MMRITVPPMFGERKLQLEPQTRTEGLRKLKEYIEEYNMNDDSYPDRPDIRSTLRRGEVSSDDGTLKEYFFRGDEIFEFSLMVGCYRTAALFAPANLQKEMRPSRPDPAVPETIANYIQYKCGKYGTPIVTKAGRHLKDVSGKELIAIGSWHSPTNLDKMSAAIKTYHKAFGHSETYVEPCEHCIQGNQESGYAQNPSTTTASWFSCSHHANAPKLRATGNVMTSPIVSDKYKHWRAELDRTHKKKGNVQLSPKQLRQIRSVLISTGNVQDLQLYTMMLLGVKLFLRADEIISMRMEHFNKNKDLFSVGRTSVRCLVVSVKGKSDDQEVLLRLFRDDENPDFCPVRHLLLYVKEIGTGESGFLFPPLNQIKSRKDSNTQR